MRKILHLAAAAALIAGLASPALAQEGRHDGRDWHDNRGWHDDRGWHDNDIHRFHDHDFDWWRGGRWIEARRDGRVGWWWVVGPQWYYYPQPIYPYPDPYQPPTVAAGPQMYYFCDNPQGYYPYVPSCATPWRAVPPG
jgi:hypothetical protein